MKKLNEDVMISDPAMAQQYANGQTQLLNKDKQINALQKQINLIEQSKNDIAKKMSEIEKKSAANQGDQVTQQLDQQQQAVQTTGQPAQQGTMNTSESIVIRVYEEDEDPKLGTLANVYDNVNPVSLENFYDVSEAYVEDDKFSRHPNEEEYDANKYLFYVRVTDITAQNEFIGKIFKTSPDGEWYGLVKDGEAKSFEQISYDASYDEEQIVDFLKETYDEVEIIDIDEFNNYIEGDSDTEDWEVKDVDESGMTGLTM